MLKFFIKNLPFTTKEAEVTELHQDISQVEMRRGSAVVTLGPDADAEAFSSELDGTSFKGRSLSVAKWEDRPPRGRDGDRGDRGGDRGRSNSRGRPDRSDRSDRSRSSSRGRTDRGPRGPRVIEVRGQVLVLGIPSVTSFLEAYSYEVAESGLTYKPTNNQPLVGCGSFDIALGTLEAAPAKKKGFKKNAAPDRTTVVQKRAFGVVDEDGALITRSTAKQEGAEILAALKAANVPTKNLVFFRFEGEAVLMSVLDLVSALGAKMDIKLILSRIYQVSQGAQEIPVFKLREWPGEDDAVISEDDADDAVDE